MGLGALFSAPCLEKLTKEILDRVQPIVNYDYPSVKDELEINACALIAFVNKACLAFRSRKDNSSESDLDRYKRMRKSIMDTALNYIMREHEPSWHRTPVLYNALLNGLIFYRKGLGGCSHLGPMPPYILDIVKEILHLAPNSLHYTDGLEDGYNPENNFRSTPPTIACANKNVPITVVEFLFQQLDDTYKSAVSKELTRHFSAIHKGVYGDESDPAHVANKTWGWPEERFSAIQNLLKKYSFPEVKWLGHS